MRVKLLSFSYPVNSNMCFGCSKEQSYGEGSFKYSQHLTFGSEIRKLNEYYLHLVGGVDALSNRIKI